MSLQREHPIRIAFAPAPVDCVTEYGLGEMEADRKSFDLVAAAFANATRVLISGTGLSRYSDGNWPVLYTARTLDTAIAEKGYWVITSIFSKKTRPDEVECLEYMLEFEGKCLELIGKEVSEPLLVHPSNYTHCWAVAKSAKVQRVDFLTVPSARRLGGINVNILSRTPVFNVTSCILSFFRPSGEFVAEYFSNNTHSVVIDDVFGSL